MNANAMMATGEWWSFGTKRAFTRICVIKLLKDYLLLIRIGMSGTLV
jgi:hypothetical protein